MIISRYIKNQGIPFHRSTGVYGHLPRFYPRFPHVSYVGYLRLITRRWVYTFWYMGNPFRHRIFERHPRFIHEKYADEIRPGVIRLRSRTRRL